MEVGDVPQSTDHYMEPAQHGVQDVLNISTEVHVFHRTDLTWIMPDLRKIMPDLAWIMPDLMRIMPDLTWIMPDLMRIMPDLTWIMPDLTWVVKKPKTDMHSHLADHPDNPASVLIFTPCIHLVRMNLDILASLLYFPCLDQI
ncbi:unnamed protein product [Brassica napus]|uniref:(rape) hypothetical protein n=1 Tax=Brassica napus TaxID=3708 RepID=A0A816QAD4_BRANA|nr:unnamed protein product [Brassica napus]